MARKSLPKGLKIAVGLSLAAHVLVVAGVVLLGNTSRAKKPLQNVIATELVRLGKKRDEKLLPRKEAPPPEPEKTTPAPSVKPPEPTTPKPPPPKEAIPSAKDRLSQMSKVQSALDRLKQQEEPEGEEDGSQYGTVAKALAGNKFASEVYACIKAHYTLEGMTEAQAALLSADVLVRVDGKGKFIESEIEKPSGNARFDQNVLRAARRCGQVSPPPPELAKQVRDDGILVKYGGR